MSAAGGLPNITGRLIELPEDDYAYGIGVLRLRVAHVASTTIAGWVTVDGYRIDHRGHQYEHRTVAALARWCRRNM